MILFRRPSTIELPAVLDMVFRGVDRSPGRAIYAEAFPAEYRRQCDAVAGHEGFCIVASKGPKLLGYALFVRQAWTSTTNYELSSIYVISSVRNQGLGTELLRKGLSECLTLGGDSCSVSLGVKRPWLRQFYEAFGFAAVSINMEMRLDESRDLAS